MVLKQRKILHFTPSVFLNLTLLTFVSSNSDTVSHYTNFVYNKCRNETHIPHNLVSSLLQELVEKSLESKFYQTATSANNTFAVSGVFQCRMDLTNDDCHTCILKTVPILLSCGSNFLARVQLTGCYLSFQPKPEPEPEPELDHVPVGGRINNRALVSTAFVEKYYLQHKKCGHRRARSDGLEEVLNAVFEAIVGCVMSSRDGHCVTMIEGAYAMGQCEGSLGRCECGKCVDNAFQVARDECWGFGSGEIYLENCFVSFSDNESNEGDRNSSRENDIGGGSAKLVAIIVGVGVALGLLSAVCYCIRSSTRKRDDW